jgi:hypothetical protein
MFGMKWNLDNEPDAIRMCENIDLLDYASEPIEQIRTRQINVSIPRDENKTRANNTIHAE